MRHLINVTDLSVEEIDELISVAKDIKNEPEKYKERCKGKILATLFFEPSTRTRLSFETAMLSLGGSVVGFSDGKNSSASKGESVADTSTVVSGYVDIIAMRHPKEGAPLVAAKHSLVPLVNAGDGGHFHPTQTLADLCTIYFDKGRLNNLTIGLCGDLKYGRTVHSLIEAMVRYKGIRFVLISPKELSLPDLIKKDVLEENGVPYVETTSLDDCIGELDVLYMTRIQQERFASQAEYERLKDSYVLTEEKMRKAKPDTFVLHPLPRVNEISVKVDKDPRASYFRQTYNGKLMRMALIMKLLEEKEKCANAWQKRGKQTETDGERETFVSETKCKSRHCITTTEQELENLAYKDKQGKTRCAYCDAEI